MKESTKFWLSCTPFLLIGVAVLLSSSFSEFMAQRRMEAWKRSPLTMQISLASATEASSPLRTETGGDMQVFEIGLLRLARPAKGVRGGGASSGNRIASTSIYSGGGSSGSSRGHRHAHNDIAYGSRHQFTGSGYDFSLDVRQGCLCIGDQRICIVDTPKLVLLDASGEIKSVTELSVSYPPLKGTVADVAALIDRAQKYAKVPPEQFAEEPWRMDPLQCQLQIKSAHEATCDSRWSGTETSLRFETALLRLIIPITGEAGTSSTQPSGVVTTAQPLDEVAQGVRGSHGSTASSPHSYRRWRAGYSTHHTFSGPGYKYTFDIIQGCLCIQGQRVSIVDRPKLVILDPDGTIKSVRELTVDYPKPIGKPADLAVVVKMAREFSERFKP